MTIPKKITLLFLPTFLLLLFFTTTAFAAQTACNPLTANLSPGSRDSSTKGEVSRLQSFLSKRGYTTVMANGVFDRSTQGALKKFQQQNSIEPTGTVGPKTRKLINNLSGCQSPTIDSPKGGTTAGAYLKAAPESLVLNGAPGTVVLSWRGINVTSCKLGEKTLPPTGTVSVPVSESTGFVVWCTGPYGLTMSNQVYVPVSGSAGFVPTPSVDLKINGSDGPLTLSSGYATFSWSSVGSASCVASGDVANWSGSKPASGSAVVWVGNEKTGVTTYQLSCEASQNSVNGKGGGADSVLVNFRY